MLRRFLPARSRSTPAHTAARFRVEQLEAREVPSVTLAPIAAQEMASNKAFFLPITVTNDPNGTVAHTVAESSPDLSAVVLTGRTVQFSVSGGSGSTAFTGTFTIQLFDQTALQTAQRIVDLINSGYYANKRFFRVEDLFADAARTNLIIQGGAQNNSSESDLPDLRDEYNSNVTFASNGLVAIANSGPDTGNSQFFITDLDRPLSDRIEFLNFKHTILGIVTSGFDTIRAMQTAARTASIPDDPILISSATVLNSSPHGVVMFVPGTNGFTGSATVTVTSTDADGPTTATFDLTGKASTENSPAFLGAVTRALTTVAGRPVTFTVPATDIDGDEITIAVRDGDTFTVAPENVSISIDQATRRVTLTPAAGFTGTITFKVGARDQIARYGASANDARNFDTEEITLTVTAGAEAPTFTASGSPAGSEPRIRIFNADGSERFNILAFDPSFRGGVIVAVGDVTGDGKPDVVAVPGFGGGPLIKVYDAETGEQVYFRMVFEDHFRGGLSLAVGDLTNSGYAQVLVGAGVTGGPRVTLLDVADDEVVMNFFSHPATLRGGVYVGIGELKSGEGLEIITAAGPGSGPDVSVYDPVTGNRLGHTFAGDPNSRAGIQFRVGDADATGNRKLLFKPYGSSQDTPESELDPLAFVDFEGFGEPVTFRDPSNIQLPDGF